MTSLDTLGEGTGGATGPMLFNFFPIGQNERFVKAYQAAVESKGGDALIDPVIKENWFWGYILNALAFNRRIYVRIAGLRQTSNLRSSNQKL